MPKLTSNRGRIDDPCFYCQFSSSCSREKCCGEEEEKEYNSIDDTDYVVLDEDDGEY